MKTTNKLEATKKINQLKIRAIRNGGYIKNKLIILKACSDFKSQFGIDHTPTVLK